MSEYEGITRRRRGCSALKGCAPLRFVYGILCVVKLNLEIVKSAAKSRGNDTRVSDIVELLIRAHSELQCNRYLFWSLECLSATCTASAT